MAADALALADAFEAVARVNHYMVGVVVEYDEDDLNAAEQHLINRQNAVGTQKGAEYRRLDLALDLVEQARTRLRHVASRRRR